MYTEIEDQSNCYSFFAKINTSTVMLLRSDSLIYTRWDFVQTLVTLPQVIICEQSSTCHIVMFPEIQ